MAYIAAKFERKSGWLC